MRGSKRPESERARAVGIAVVTSIPEASRQTGIPDSTIRQWYDLPEYAELRERTKEVRNQEWEVGIQLAFRRAVVLLDRTEDPVKAATAGAIMFDKLALSRGEATGRTESRSLHDDLNDHERATLKAILTADVAEGEEAGGDSGTGMDAATPPDPA